MICDIVFEFLVTEQDHHSPSTSSLKHLISYMFHGAYIPKHRQTILQSQWATLSVYYKLINSILQTIYQSSLSVCDLSEKMTTHVQHGLIKRIMFLSQKIRRAALSRKS